MAERRFTRLKASLSETAAKTRENVSRELRQSIICETNSFSENSDIFCEFLEENYEEFVRNYLQKNSIDFKDVLNDLLISEQKPIDCSINCPKILEIDSLFGKKCLKYLTEKRNKIFFSEENRFFGSVFECFCERNSEIFSFELKSHLFCDSNENQNQNQNEFEEEIKEKEILKEINCLMNRMTGYLFLTKEDSTDSSILSFFRDKKRSQIVWNQEIQQKVEKYSEKCFKIDCHLIEMKSKEEIEEWIKAINESLFDSIKHSKHLKDFSNLNQNLNEFFIRNSLNIFDFFYDLNQRKGIFASIRQIIPENDFKKTILKFKANFKKFEINDKNLSQFVIKIALFDSKVGRISSLAEINTNNNNKKCFSFSLDTRLVSKDVFLVSRVFRVLHSQHLEPFVWSARPLFKSEITPRDHQLDTLCPFSLFFRSNLLSDEHVTQSLNQSKGTTISAKLSLQLKEDKEEEEEEEDNEEVIDFLLPICEPIKRFENSLFVCLQSLRFENQKMYSKARNILICVELKNEDKINSKALKLIYSKEKKDCFEEQYYSSTTKHQMNPEFCDEIEIKLPLKMSNKLHLLFSLFHISCKKENKCLKTSIGFSWIQINNKTTHGLHSLSVFHCLSDSYLSCQSLGLGRGLSMPDMKLVLKEVFRIECRLKSSIISSDPIIETTMECVTQINSEETDICRALSAERSLQRNLKSLLKASKSELNRFSHVILQQLVLLSCRPLGSESLKIVLKILKLLSEKTIFEFIEETFFAPNLSHETILLSLNRFIRQIEEEKETKEEILRYFWFFFRIHIKSCLQYLLQNDLKDKEREKRFSKQFSNELKDFCENVSQIIVLNSRLEESFSANKCFAYYLSRLLSFCDRNQVFNSIFFHLQNTFSRDIVISELRLTTLAIITSHENYIPFNYPFIRRENEIENQRDFELNLNFKRKHFLVSLLLQEFKHCLSSSVRHTRQQSLQLLRNLLAKHSKDERISENLKQIISSLYFPVIYIIIENVNRIVEQNNKTNNKFEDKERDSSSSSLHTKQSSISSTITTTSSSHTRHNSLPVRFDAFNSDEIKDIVICFAFIAKHLEKEEISYFCEEKGKQCLRVLQTGVQIFQLNSNLLKSKSKTLPNNENSNSFHNFLYKQNISIQISLIALKTIRLIVSTFSSSQNVFETVFSLLITLLQVPQSLHILIHIFENIRYLSSNYSEMVFNSQYFSQLVSILIQFQSNSIKSVRNSSVDLIFVLFSLNFRRTRFETIVCVSRLASKDDTKDSSLSRFQLSLKRLYLLSKEDLRLKQTVERVLDILQATHRIRSEARNQYESCELRLFLANSYAQTSLRRTWLENLAESHKQNNDWTENAICLSHVIAIVVKELKSKRNFKGFKGLENASKHLQRISPNLIEEELLEEETIQDSNNDFDETSIESLSSLIDDCVLSLEKCQLFELASNALKILVDVFEEEKDHKKLSQLYSRLSQMHSKAQQLNDSGKRLFDTYFRVAFCSNGETNDEFIYRESKVVSLAEMIQKMHKIHPNSVISSDSSEASIVVTHVQPKPMIEKDLIDNFVGINCFQFEQRIKFEEKEEKDLNLVSKQRKKRVILKTQHFLPFCVKRVAIISRFETILQPIEVAIDEMAERVKQLERVLQSQDVKHLQLVLQGSVHVTVNQGPLAYAEAFLNSNENNEKSEELKQLFSRFLDLCEKCLQLNEKLIKEDQIEYQLALKQSFDKLRLKLDFEEPKRSSVQIFDVISGSSLA